MLGPLKSHKILCPGVSDWHTMNGTRLYGNDDDFWTSEGSEVEESSDDSSDDEDETERITGTIDGLALVYEELKNNGKNTQEIEGEGLIYNEGKGDIPVPAVIAPTKKAIRKTWVIHDTLPVDNFSEEVQDPAFE